MRTFILGSAGVASLALVLSGALPASAGDPPPPQEKPIQLQNSFTNNTEKPLTLLSHTGLGFDAGVVPTGLVTAGESALYRSNAAASKVGSSVSYAIGDTNLKVTFNLSKEANGNNGVASCTIADKATNKAVTRSDWECNSTVYSDLDSAFHAGFEVRHVCGDALCTPGNIDALRIKNEGSFQLTLEGQSGGLIPDDSAKSLKKGQEYYSLFDLPHTAGWIDVVYKVKDGNTHVGYLQWRADKHLDGSIEQKCSYLNPDLSKRATPLHPSNCSTKVANGEIQLTVSAGKKLDILNLTDSDLTLRGKGGSLLVGGPPGVIKKGSIWSGLLESAKDKDYANLLFWFNGNKTVKWFVDRNPDGSLEARCVFVDPGGNEIRGSDKDYTCTITDQATSYVATIKKRDL